MFNYVLILVWGQVGTWCISLPSSKWDRVGQHQYNHHQNIQYILVYLFYKTKHLNFLNLSTRSSTKFSSKISVLDT